MNFLGSNDLKMLSDFNQNVSSEKCNKQKKKKTKSNGWQEKETQIKLKASMKNVKKMLFPIVTMPLPIYLVPKKQRISDSFVKFYFLFKKNSHQSHTRTNGSIQKYSDELNYSEMEDKLCKQEYEKAFTLRSGQLPDDIKKKLAGRHNENFAILIHGWTDSFDDVYRFYGKGWMVLTGLDWRKYGDTNVIAVDWKPIAILDYMSAGKFFLNHIAETIKKITILIDEVFQEENQHFNTKERLSVAGHSLGAHIAGILGHSLEGQIKYICAMDPAGLNFHHLIVPMFKKCRLSEESAQLVHVLHTSIGLYGNKFLLGHADFFANGGRNQPGCTGLLKQMNSHLRSINLFRYSLNPNIDALGYKCEIDDERKEYPKNSVRKTNSCRFGIHYETNRNGVFYIFTKNNEPYFERLSDSKMNGSTVSLSHLDAGIEISEASNSNEFDEGNGDIFIPAYKVKTKKKGTQMQVRFSKRKNVSIN